MEIEGTDSKAKDVKFRWQKKEKKRCFKVVCFSKVYHITFQFLQVSETFQKLHISAQSVRNTAVKTLTNEAFETVKKQPDM